MLHKYQTDAIIIYYDLKKCTHVAECIMRLPDVFNTNQLPWVQPEKAEVGKIVEAILACPTGALHFKRKDGGPEETPPDRNTIEIIADGPLNAAGRLEILRPDHTVFLEDTRAALCRCGQTKNPPFCDNSHLTENFFEASGGLPAGGPAAEPEDTGPARPLRITLEPNGPLAVEGPMTLADPDGNRRCLSRCSLCRCGASEEKPFCDGSHVVAGFAPKI